MSDRLKHRMTATEKIINDLTKSKLILCLPRMLTLENCVRIGQTITSAIDLLKEQEPVLLKNQQQLNANSPWISKCPKCGKKIEGRQTRFCKYCGQAVKWE